MIIIGDVHGRINNYWMLTRHTESLQVGDFGFKKQHDWFIENMDITKHKINFGNHDYIPYKYMEHSTGDFGYENGIFTVRGAASIDKSHRIEGRDWFRDEELTYREGVAALDKYEEIKPEIVVTHDAPQRVVDHHWSHITESSMTRKLLDEMFEIHQPTLWFFGHHHQSKNEFMDGTNFICLAELETYTL